MTKREFFTMAMTLTDNADFIAHAEHEIELLDNKNAKRSSKPNVRQLNNETIKANIVTLLTNAEPMTISMIAKAYNEKYNTDYSPNKFNSLITQLKNNGTVTRFVEKKVPYFTLATE